MEIQLPLEARIGLAVMALFFGLLVIATIWLHLRVRTRPTLAMSVAAILGCSSVALAWFGPRETVTTTVQTAPVSRSDRPLSDSPRFVAGARSTRTSSVFPVTTWIIYGSLALWGTGFLVYSMTASKQR